MLKHQKIHKRAKKESKISSSLRFHFLKMIYIEKSSVKDAAQKFNLNYSSAKVIARQGKLSNIQKKFAKLKMYLKQPTLNCQYKLINRDQKVKQYENSQKSAQPESQTNQKQSKKTTNRNVIILSTVGYNYFKQLDNVIDK